jgi:hypothetical protein
MRKAYFNRADNVVSRETYLVYRSSIQLRLDKKLKLSSHIYQQHRNITWRNSANS